MISPPLASFLEEGLSLHIGTRDAELNPQGGRAAALAVEPDGAHVLVYVPARAMTRMRADLQTIGLAAVSIGRPVDERACQVKGVVVDIRAAREDERPLVAAQWEGFMRQLESIGIQRAVASGWSMWPADVVRMRVTAVFEQTPKPDTGYPIA
jgi:hypothetical protein